MLIKFVKINVCASRNAYLTALKISKLLLNAVGYAYVQMVAEAMQNEPSPVTISVVIHSHAVLLQKALQSIPNPNSECMIRSMAVKLGQFLSHRVRIFSCDILILNFLALDAL